ncbi:DUF4242 domain-containing protein [Streptomyces sp. DSM 44915]|uniref:DUF4242 domain-containing protein n=1 Tax=Streptomyces chisholmiae TaxID=3075540 RepID=A0ABU2JW71_9ACTN|nr:DUF4242 domain-containing protein [Streptomyces sp. DSM 44915]MDT0268993.1 DUF4242 domain-containing protein [Streptomyces sp. DSM 44915]
MPLYLFEVTTSRSDRTAELIDALGRTVAGAGGEVIEAQVTAQAARVFLVVEAPGADLVAAAVLAAELPGAAEVSGPDQVRLVGADLAEVKAARPTAGYLVEWDLPAELDMASYLARKKANAPRYAEVPEVDFLRTYVREDMVKCLCFYDAPGEKDVLRAREAVSTPVDRLHALAPTEEDR